MPAVANPAPPPICPITGVELPPATGKRGRPPQYINADARKLMARMQEVDRLVLKLAEEVGFTRDAEKKLRGWAWDMANLLNRNRLRAEWKKRPPRSNPRDAVHALLMTQSDGLRLAVCGATAPIRIIDTPSGKVATSPLMVSSEPTIVDCPRCRAAISVPKKSSRP